MTASYLAGGLLVALVATSSEAQVVPPRPFLPAGSSSSSAAASEQRLTLRVGTDLPLLTGFVFRGLIQEFRPRLTLQPYAEVGVAVSRRIVVNVGAFTSFHTGTIRKTVGPFYALDPYGAVTFVAGNWKPGVMYTLYTSPSGGYQFVGDEGSVGVSELAFFATYDDSASRVPLSPAFALAVETTATQADFGAHKGSYVEAGIAPVFGVLRKPRVTLAVPVKVGASLKDYYELGGRSSRFGFLLVGAEARVPLPKLNLGRWEAHAGLEMFVLGKDLRFPQGDDTTAKTVKPVLTLGVSAQY